MTLLELARRFPDEEAAHAWFERVFWPDGVKSCPQLRRRQHARLQAPHDAAQVSGLSALLRHPGTGTIMEGSPRALLKWLYAIYLDVTAPEEHRVDATQP